MAGAPYRKRFNLDEWRKRFKDTLAARFVLRFHMTLILLLVVAGGLITTRLFYKLGVTSMALRYLATVCVGYGAFFLLIRAWLAYLTDAVRQEDPHAHPHDEEVIHALASDDDDTDAASTPAVHLDSVLASASATSERRARGSSWGTLDMGNPGINIGSSSASSSGSSGSSGSFSLDLDDGAAALVIGLVVAVIALVVFGAAVYFIWEAPVILGEAAVEIVLASALIRGSRRIDRPGWSGSVLRATWVPASIVLAMAVAGGWIAQGLCPSANTLPGVIEQCVQRETGGG